MNITEQNIGLLESRIHLSFGPETYNPRVEKTLKNYRNQANIPGFRKGQAPIGMIKRMYGQSVLYEEVNKLVQESLDNYLKENNIQIFAYPVPAEDSPLVDLEKNDKVELVFEIGKRPDFDLTLPAEGQVTRYAIFADDAFLEEHISNLRKRFYEDAYPEKSASGDVLFIRLKALGEDFEELQPSMTTFKLDEILDDSLKQALTGVEKNYEHVVKLSQFFTSPDEQKKMIRNESASDELLASDFQLTLTNIMREGEAEINSEFFAKIFPDKGLTDYESFKAAVKEDIDAILVNESLNRFRSDILKEILQINDFPIPENFLKTFFTKHAEKKVKVEEMEQEFPNYAAQIKQDVVMDKIMKQYELTVNYNEIVDRATRKFMEQFTQYGLNLSYEEARGYALKQLENGTGQEELYSEVRFNKVLEHLDTLVSSPSQEISFSEFRKLNEA